MIRAAGQLVDKGIAEPILVGDRDSIGRTSNALVWSRDLSVVDPDVADLDAYAERLHDLRKRNGITRREADELIRTATTSGA